MSTWASRGAVKRAGEKTFETLVDKIDDRIATLLPGICLSTLAFLCI